MHENNQSQKFNKKRAYTTQHSGDMLNMALNELRNKKMSSYAAEKIFGIPRRTLLDKLHNKHPKKTGCPTRLSDEEEANIIKVIIAAADFGCPLNLLDLRVVVYRYLEGSGRHSIFNNKLPGKKWAYLFIKRNKSKLTYRMIQNIKRGRAEKSPEEMKEYFANLKTSLEGVPIQNVVNYDETNLTDNPGVKKCLVRRGVKYPERVLNYTKGAISIMFAITAGVESLPPYVVYKAEHLYSQWMINGPKGSRFNRSKSGWFDSILFEDWFENIILPWAKSTPGKKVLIGDNLASHINYKIVSYCEQNDIRFVFLPPNSSHITQPLDVCYFGPLKKLWREILLNYKIRNPREATINKGHFPELLKQLVERLNDKRGNITSAFSTTGIVPLNPEKVIKRLPNYERTAAAYTIDQALLDWLKETRSPDPNKKVRNKKLNVPAGKSVCADDFADLVKVERVKKNKKEKNSSNVQIDEDFFEPSFALQNSLVQDNPDSFQNSLVQDNPDSLRNFLVQDNPDSLKKICINSINSCLSVETTQKTLLQVSNIHNFDKLSRTDEANMTFIGDIPECLKTIKPKIKITSDVVIKAGPSRNIKKNHIEKNSVIKKGAMISRSALDMKLVPRKNETTAEQRKVLKEITQEVNGKLDNNRETAKKLNKANKRTIKCGENTKVKKKIQKSKCGKRTKKRLSSISSSSTNDDMSLADTDKSDYETIEDFMMVCQQEEQEEEDVIPYGISDIQYEPEEDNKLKMDSWILVKFVTKKSQKHYVGKVISIRNNVPEVKFVRKVKESKLNKESSVFSYPNVDDICTVMHSEDIVMVLPDPNVSRRGRIVFNVDLRSYNVQ